MKLLETFFWPELAWRGLEKRCGRSKAQIVRGFADFVPKNDLPRGLEVRLASDVDGRMDFKQIWWRMERILAISGFDTWLNVLRLQTFGNILMAWAGLSWLGKTVRAI